MWVNKSSVFSWLSTVTSFAPYPSHSAAAASLGSPTCTTYQQYFSLTQVNGDSHEKVASVVRYSVEEIREHAIID